MTEGTGISIGVVIPAYRDSGIAAECIESVLGSDLPAGHSLELVVVDNSVGRARIDHHPGSPVAILRPDKNLGICEGRNAGMRALPSSDIVVFVDEDVVLDRLCLRELAGFLATHDDAGVATALITYSESLGRIWAAGTNIDTRSGRVSFVTEVSGSEPFRVGVAPSVIAVTRAALDVTAGFDTDYFATYEDSDFCLRSAEANLYTYCVPSARARHHTPTAVSQQRRHLASRSYWIGRNRILFMRRHGTRPSLFALMWPVYAAYYGLVALASRKPLSFLQFLHGSLDGVLFPKRSGSLWRRPEWIVVGVATALVAIWFHGGVLLGAGDQGPSFLRPDVDFAWSWQIWNNAALGGTHPELVAGWPFWGTIDLFWKLGIPAWALEAGVYWSSMVVAAVSVMSLARHHCRADSVAPLISSLVYLLAPFTTINVWHRYLLTYQLFFALLPLSLALLRKYYGTGQFRHVVVLVIAMPWFAECFVSPGLAVVIAVMILADSAYMAWVGGRRPVGRRFLLGSGGMIVANVYWMIPLALQGPSALSGPGLTAAANYANFVGSSAYTDISNVFRSLNGYYLQGGLSLGWPYRSGPFLSLLFLLPLLGFSALLLRRNGSSLYLTALGIAGVFLAKGSSPPGGFLLGDVIRRFQLAGSLRNTYEMCGFIYLLAIALLVGVTASEISTRLTGSRLRPAALPIGIALLVVCGWPTISGSVFSTPQFGSYRVAPPEQYSSLSTTIDALGGPESRAIVAPVTDQGISYLWRHGYRGVDPMDIMDPHSISMTSGTAASPSILRELARFPEGPEASELPRILGARFVVVRSDINPKPDHLLPVTVVRGALASSPDYQLVKQRGPLAIYRLGGCIDAPMYATPVVMFRKTSSWESLAQSVGPDCATVVSPHPGLPRISEPVVPPSPPQSLHFVQLSSTAYSARLPAGFTGWVVLNVATSSGWSARLVSRVPSCPLASVACLSIETQHSPALAGPYLANSYANAWFVQAGGPTNILILYSPQSIVEVSALASAFLLLLYLACIGLLVLRRRRRRPALAAVGQVPHYGSRFAELQGYQAYTERPQKLQ
ncbi:MAG: glycosyltransferase [Actinomycetota bacterium]|jgi:GT2 family glycosyltransferase|nr:glycosyltransferase [Actinomycetota bacterium]